MNEVIIILHFILTSSIVTFNFVRLKVLWISLLES